ncbi:hypothetical protein PSCICM_40820 [Pseudomonas cichorii]|uniref:Uncharacterized protein n=1 Tax=Pseudomonas cichorii TaxID=36746 RepID=A0ABQ1DV73_PSECI|nr:hypothetical protein PSCICM_40820 [Pseudomonas cichorii]GFM94918.1 hypothetical protein PSCICP_48900 [Pseudomonas cichorii]
MTEQISGGSTLGGANEVGANSFAKANNQHHHPPPSHNHHQSFTSMTRRLPSLHIQQALGQFSQPAALAWLAYGDFA